jgi:hypothetical protein
MSSVDILEDKLYEWLDGRIYLPPIFLSKPKRWRLQAKKVVMLMAIARAINEH